MLIELATGVELFHSATGTAYGDLTLSGRRETWPVRSTRFRTWLRHRYYAATGLAASPAAVNAALDLLEARAQFDSPERAVHVRVAEHDGHIYLDLGDAWWRAAEVSHYGWRIVTAPPVRFVRSPGMLALPLPQRGGSIELLSGFLNLPDRDAFVLLVSWLLAALRATGPYPLLAIAGEQGSSKTFLTKVLRALIDPNFAPVRAAPRDERELFISARNAHVLAYDNLSGMLPWISDALCRLASGGSFAVRRLYTDGEEALFEAARPVVLNGIEEVITRPDLADRAIFLTLEPIAEQRRRTEQELWRDFELQRPAILGALLDAVSHGLMNLPHVRIRRWPRMADFAQWATACKSALGPGGTFLRAYQENRRSACEGVLDADPVAARVREIMTGRSTWSGSASELLRAGAALDGLSFGWDGWPTDPRRLAGRLRRAQPLLRTLGIEIAFSREGRLGTRIIRIHSSARSASSASSAPARSAMAAQERQDPMIESPLCGTGISDHSTDGADATDGARNPDQIGLQRNPSL